MCAEMASGRMAAVASAAPGAMASGPFGVAGAAAWATAQTSRTGIASDTRCLAPRLPGDVASRLGAHRGGA